MRSKLRRLMVAAILAAGAMVGAVAVELADAAPAAAAIAPVWIYNATYGSGLGCAAAGVTGEIGGKWKRHECRSRSDGVELWVSYS